MLVARLSFLIIVHDIQNFGCVSVCVFVCGGVSGLGEGVRTV